jgi:hypothetical protein
VATAAAGNVGGAVVAGVVGAGVAANGVDLAGSGGAGGVTAGADAATTTGGLAGAWACWRQATTAATATTSAPAPSPISSGRRVACAAAGAAGISGGAWIVGALPSWRSACAFLSASRM